jgi:hypothetical protein
MENFVRDTRCGFIYSLFDVKTASEEIVHTHRDCYSITFDALLDLVIEHIKDNENIIIVERGDKGLNKKIQMAWEKVKSFGTEKTSARKINRKIKSFELKGKSDNISGLQICDLLVSQISRQYLGLKPKIDINIVRAKVTAHAEYKKEVKTASQP